MAEYIERERAEIIFRDARLALKPEGCKDWNEYVTRDVMLMNAEQVIHIIPAADVVPVVRCKDCKHGTRLVCDLAGNEYIECRHGNIARRLDWFCADGAKMDGGNE